MTEKVTLDVSQEEFAQLEKRAHKQGYATVSDYLLSLIRLDLEEYDEDPVQGFREG